MNEKNILETLKEIYQESVDLSSRSDELASSTPLWAVARRLARGRVDPLRMLTLNSRDRVLVLDPGDGAWTRFILEQGIQTTALVPSALAASTLRTRTADWENLEIRREAEVSEPSLGEFDWILAPSESANGLLGRNAEVIRSSLKPEGRLFAAFENPLSIAHILGYQGRGELGGDTGKEQPHKKLRARLTTIGLCHQEWSYAYPEVGQPSVVFADALWDRTEVVDLVDQIVKYPLNLAGPKAPRGYDLRQLHRIMLKEGLGRSVAGGFFVLAAANPREAKWEESSLLAWLFGADRLNCWRRVRALRERVDLGLVLEDLTAEENAVASWIRQQRTLQVPWIQGRTLEQSVLEACRVVDREGLKQALEKWLLLIQERVSPSEEAFLDRLIPPNYLDVELSNFVVGVTGEGHYIDDEWILDDPPKVRLPIARALVSLAGLLVRSGLVAFWGRRATVQDIAVSLGNLLELDLQESDFEAGRTFEARLVQTVHGGMKSDHYKNLCEAASQMAWKPIAETGALPKDSIALTEALQALRIETEDVYADRDRLEADTQLLKEELNKVSAMYWSEKESRIQLEHQLAEDRDPRIRKHSFWSRFLKE